LKQAIGEIYQRERCTLFGSKYSKMILSSLICAFWYIYLYTYTCIGIPFD